MKVVTAEMMRALDRGAMEGAGIPGSVLMENAGRAVFEALVDRCGNPAGRTALVWCGTGNNGGDGFVAARYLALAGARVALRLVGDPERLAGDARTHFAVLGAMGVHPQGETPAPIDMQVDALLGTGARGAPRGGVADAVRAINVASCPTIAVDIPSGVDSDTGAVAGDAVRAVATVTFGYPKLGLLLAPGADHAGEIVVRDIGFDWSVPGGETPYEWIRPAEVHASLGPTVRPPEAYKGMFGHVLVVGGSTGMSGAPTMTARAALRAGAGLVTVAAPASAQAFVAGKIDEAMTLPVPERDGALGEAAFEPIRRLAERCDVLCLGPGATQQPEARSLLLRVLREVDLPAVVDADGLNALSSAPETLRGRTAPVVLTPHPGECGRLLDLAVRDVEADRVAAVRRAAQRYRAVVVLKGRRTLVCDGRAADEGAPALDRLPVAINTSGNPGMATAGSGDSLTGIVGALLGQGLDAFAAAKAGVYLHGRAGDLAARSTGEAGLVAGDIVRALPGALQEREGQA